jgi:hypothetical protein
MTNPFVGNWTYRSLINNPDINVDFDALEFARANLVITEAAPAELGGTLYAPGMSLDLHGSFGFGTPMQIRFQGKGVISGNEWIYDYIGWLVPVWPSSTDDLQTAAIVGSVTRTIPHPNGQGGMNPAGVVASFYAVLQPPAS